MKNKKLLPWLPTIITAVLTIPFAIYYSIFGARLLSTYLQIAVGALIPAVFPIMGLITKKQYSVSLSACTAVLCILGIHFAKAIDLYSVWQRYDIFLHTNFGLVGSAMLYALLLRWQGDKMSVAGQLVFIFLGVLGLGALWEILEYTCSWFTGEDPQRSWGAVWEAIEAGKPTINPVYDTMQDLTVTAIGSAVFMIGYYIDAFAFKGRFYQRFFSNPSDLKKLV